MTADSTPPASPTKPATPIRPAASVVILRDGADGIETFMLARNEGAGMAFSGAFVFPGGKVDAEDSAPEWRRLAPPVPPIPDHPFWIAAVRETFEEAGLVLARQAMASSLLDADTAHRIVQDEREQREGGAPRAFLDTITRENLTLVLDQMIHFGHWITPAWAPRRFDTHFFLVAAPVDQAGHYDEGESQEGLWIRPADALAQAAAGQRTLVPVTRFTLELLASWRSVEEAVAAARKREIVTVMPKMEKRADGRVLRIPENAGYLTSELFIPEG